MCQAQRRIRNWTVHHEPAAGPRALASRIAALNASRWARSSSGRAPLSAGSAGRQYALQGLYAVLQFVGLDQPHSDGRQVPKGPGPLDAGRSSVRPDEPDRLSQKGLDVTGYPQPDFSGNGYRPGHFGGP
jgi:hypothetical protein